MFVSRVFLHALRPLRIYTLWSKIPSCRTKTPLPYRLFSTDRWIFPSTSLTLFHVYIFLNKIVIQKTSGKRCEIHTVKLKRSPTEFQYIERNSIWFGISADTPLVVHLSLIKMHVCIERSNWGFKCKWPFFGIDVNLGQVVHLLMSCTVLTNWSIHELQNRMGSSSSQSIHMQLTQHNWKGCRKIGKSEFCPKFLNFV